MITADIFNQETEVEHLTMIIPFSISSTSYQHLCALYCKHFLTCLLYMECFLLGNVLCVGFKGKHME